MRHSEDILWGDKDPTPEAALCLQGRAHQDGRDQDPAPEYARRVQGQAPQEVTTALQHP